MSLVSEKINLLKQIQLEDAEITDVSYVEKGTFDAPDGVVYPIKRSFYRVVIEATPTAASRIGIELWLPEEWNETFLGTGNGGMGGVILYKDFLVAYASKGYAVANTDVGTARGAESAIQNPEVWKDYGWRATHLMTVFGKQILREFYGKKEKYAYFLGTSKGGQQAMMEAQRFPEDYDGIMAGDLAHNFVNLMVYWLWNRVHSRTPEGRGLFSLEEIRRLRALANRYFRQYGDGEEGDDFVTWPYRDAHTIEDFMEYLQETYPELTQEQRTALRAIYEGPKNPRTGEQIFAGMPIGGEENFGGLREGLEPSNPMFYGHVWTFGADYDGYRFDFDQDMETMKNALAGDLNANDANLDAFAAHGGKLLLCAGSADAGVPYTESLHYYEKVMERMGGYANAAAFCRYFVVPGRGHGWDWSGTSLVWGDEEGKADWLDILRDWRENGKVPESVYAARIPVSPQGFENDCSFVRKIYPYGSAENPLKEHAATCSERYL